MFRSALVGPTLLLVRQSFKAQVKARVIVQDGQCLSRATHRGQWPFEIHLPKTIGHLTLETVPVGLGRLTASIDQPMTVKDSGDGARGRQSLFTLILQKTTDLARSPAWISTTQRYQGLFFSLSQLTGTFLGTTRMIGETFASLLTVSVQPLVAGFPTDAITLAQLRKAHRFFLRQSHKLLAQRHETNHSPRHKLSPLSISGRTMPLVTEKVLPMSPVHLLPMSPVYTSPPSRGRKHIPDSRRSSSDLIHPSHIAARSCPTESSSDFPSTLRPSLETLRRRAGSRSRRADSRWKKQCCHRQASR